MYVTLTFYNFSKIFLNFQCCTDWLLSIIVPPPPLPSMTSLVCFWPYNACASTCWPRQCVSGARALPSTCILRVFRRDDEPTLSPDVTHDPRTEVTCYLFEQCVLQSQHDAVVYCRQHGILGPYFIASLFGDVTCGHIAPDAVRHVSSVLPVSFPLLCCFFF